MVSTDNQGMINLDLRCYQSKEKPWPIILQEKCDDPSVQEGIKNTISFNPHKVMKNTHRPYTGRNQWRKKRGKKKTQIIRPFFIPFTSHWVHQTTFLRKSIRNQLKLAKGKENWKMPSESTFSYLFKWWPQESVSYKLSNIFDMANS